jgi:hypothetical protein
LSVPAALTLWLLAAAAGAEPGAPPPPAAAPAATTAPAPAEVPAPSNAREPALLERLDRGTLPPGFMKLGPDTEPFLAWFEPAQDGEPRGALLLVPADGQFIGNDPFIAACMALFPPGGWAVLAVQTPLLPAVSASSRYAALRDAALARLRLGVAHLTAQGPAQLVVAGRDAGAALALALAPELGTAVRGIATIGAWAGEAAPGAWPVLELTAERDAAAAREAERRERARRATPAAAAWRREVLAGADRRYAGFEEDLARRLRGWADRLPAPALAAKP